MRLTASPWAAVSIIILVSVGMLALTAEPGKTQSSTTQPPAIAPPPYDLFEPVTSEPQTVDWNARAPVYAQLVRALRKSAFEAANVPYDVKISFNASGDAKEIGAGEMEETRNAAGVRRWTGHIGDYSLTRIVTETTYDVGSPGPIPMRLRMAREYALGVPPPPMLIIRTANAALNGTPLDCLLLSERPTAAPGRDWSELEYCIDLHTQLLRVYSTAPGIYVVYDYGGSSFHDHIVPDQVTAAVGGKIVLQGIITVTDPDPSSLDPALFTPTRQMAADGVQLTQPPIRHVQSRTTNTPSSSLLPIVIHAILSPEGRVVEAEALQTSDSELSRSAIDLVKNTKYDYPAQYSVPVQLEIFATVQ